ncbi:hypothetical protein V8Z80_19695 [Orrella sp. JC864]|uniref:hypothetical protein n=1 Tax=Orrella sp. JC864 TaxID=3120298 RepID=UPI0012BD63AD
MASPQFLPEPPAPAPGGPEAPRAQEPEPDRPQRYSRTEYELVAYMTYKYGARPSTVSEELGRLR